MALSKEQRRLRIKRRVRKKISGTAERPRLTVFRSNKQIYVQAIDDIKGATLFTVSSLDKTIAEKKIAKLEQAELVGKLAADKSSEAGISEVIFDRNGYLYHGRIKALADAARKGGLKF
jgi:large subunit ribosomal protein L18